MSKKVDYVIVGAGLFGVTFARLMREAGRTVHLLDQRPHIAGNCYTQSMEGIQVHTYGPHIFHTSNRTVWDFVNRFATFNHFVNRPKVHYKDRLYSFPINLMTLYQLWGVKTPAEAEAKLASVRIPNAHPKNLEEWILSQVGPEIYETFIKGYTTKQWQRDPKDLPALIIRRLPIRLTFDDNYFNDPYQGIPIGGYTQMIANMLGDAPVSLDTDYFSDRAYWSGMAAKKVVYTGKIDAYFDYRLGELEYRTLRFENKVMDIPDYQGNAVINYTDAAVPYTRVAEHKHFELSTGPKTVVTWEYPDDWQRDKVPYYPINDEKNTALYNRYRDLALREKNVIFGGRLAQYKYYDMHHVIEVAMAAAEKELRE
jgi:UDP-galactopyranose mutase